MKNNDWSLIQDEFGNVNKLIEKSKMLILKNGIPPFYIRMLAEVEDHVANALKDKEAVKKMKPVVARALNQMKLQVRKHNDGYKDQIADFRSNPGKYEEEVTDTKPKSKKAVRIIFRNYPMILFAMTIRKFLVSDVRRNMNDETNFIDYET